MSVRLKQRLGYVFFAAAGGGVGYYRFVRDHEAKFSSYPDFTNHFNIMARNLRSGMYSSMTGLRSPSGFSIDDCIKPGVEVPGSVYVKRDPGIVAGDEECFSIFSDIFHTVIDELYPNAKDHTKSLDELQGMQKVFDPKYVLRVSAHVYRNIHDFPYSPAISRGQRRRAAETIEPVVKSLGGELAGTHKRLADLSKTEINMLAAEGVNYQRPEEPVDIAAGVVRDWPDARSLLVNAKRNFYVLVNGRHHIEIGAHQQGADIGKVISNVATASHDIEDRLPLLYQWRPRYGFMGYSMGEIGNAFKMEVMVDLPKCSAQVDFLKRLNQLGLKAVPHVDEDKGIWRLASKPSFETESHQARKFVAAISSLIQDEETLASVAYGP
eukprot:TRINITY_DN13814_c0_g1_i1.p1 TRINITY_DN13814_c0_g1~~TRINITY_DN13814_c0_g1_i1.p1  ORF type:complete len:381 (+),score=121.38 TRINITY_DN13814_c0_g1_i1:86-1228(+)